MNAPFWSDDFDMDLLKVFPDVERILEPWGNLPIWTVGHTTHDRLNHPTCWNSYGAFIWLDKPNLKRDEHGWFSISGHVSDSPEVECTWLELLRDAWSHHYGWMLLPEQRQFPAMAWAPFETIMWNMRKWGELRDVEAGRVDALRWITRCQSILERVMETRSAVGVTH